MADLPTGADAELGDCLAYQQYNRLKDHWRQSDPCANLANIQPGMIVSDSDDEKLYHYWAAECRMILQEQDNTFIVDPGGGGHYTTIQAALDAENAGGELFLIAPNDYGEDTIDFSANNQCIRGMGQTPQADVHAVDAAICDFGAWTGCRIEDIKMRMTDPTTAKDMITGSGSLRLRWCHVEVNVDDSGPAGADQPTCIDTTGEVIMTLGSLIYTNSKDDVLAIKAAIRTGVGADVCLRRVIVDIDGSNAALATTPVYGTAGLFTAYRCHIDVADDDALNTIGLAYSNVGGGTHEFMGNWVHVSNTNFDAFGLYLLSTENVRSMYNHYHIIGDEAFSFSVAAGASVVSQFDDIVAADGPTGTIANISWVSSEVDGEQSISRYLNFNPAMLTGEWGAKFMSIADGAGDPTYSLMVQSDAEGIANSSDTRLGLDESNRTFIICGRGDIGTDFGLVARANPEIYVYNAAGNTYSYLRYSRLVLGSGASSFEDSAFFTTVDSSHNTLKLHKKNDMPDGNAFELTSDANIELTDTNAEQAWLYLEPKVKHTLTAAFDALDINLFAGNTYGDGSTGDGNNFARFCDNGALKFRVDVTGGIFPAGMKSGANQGAAGAAVGELWWDTDDNAIYMGV